MSFLGGKHSQDEYSHRLINELYTAREEIKRLQRQVDRLGKDKAKLQSQLLEAVAMKVDVPFESFAEMRSREKDRY